MNTGGGSPVQRRPRHVAGRARSLRQPAPAVPPIRSNSRAVRHEPASGSAGTSASAENSHWTKLAALASATGTLLAATAAIGALWFTGQSLRATNAQLGISQQTAVTDRFRLAAEQLASDKINVRLSGIYLLQRLAYDSPADQATVYAVLAAFVRTQAPVTSCDTTLPAAPVDIQAAVTTIGRRDVSQKNPATPSIDLSRTCLTAIDLPGAQLAGVNLTEANLRYANLENAHLTDANLTRADLVSADLSDVSLDNAKLIYANMDGTNLIRANLTGANLIRANMMGTVLTDANLSTAMLSFASLHGADLAGTDLRGTDLSDTDLSDATLIVVQTDRFTTFPKGFVLPPTR